MIPGATSEPWGSSRRAPGFIRRSWDRFWSRAPRQLRTTTSGKIVLAIAFAAGFAAINTGNNLLFLAWALVLSGIVLSGVLSEANLRPIHLRLGSPEAARVGHRCAIPVDLHNRHGRRPSFALEVTCRVEKPGGVDEEPGAFLLRLGPGEEHPGFIRYAPTARGLHRVRRLGLRTTYPFGFFEKERRMAPRTSIQFWVGPARVDVESLALALRSSLGEDPARRAGPGDEMFSLRPFRTGDDPRRIAWRRTARTGRPVIIETEARATRDVRLRLCLGPRCPPAQFERALSILGSVAEDLLGAGYRVGLGGEGIQVPVGAGERHRRTCLLALAQVTPGPGTTAGTTPSSRARGAEVALVGPGGIAPPDCDARIPMDSLLTGGPPDLPETPP